MMSSVLLNPQLLLYSAALGRTALIVRLLSCFLCGCTAGWLVRACFRNKPFFDFRSFHAVPTGTPTPIHWSAIC